MSRDLWVWVLGERVGTLSFEAPHLRFRYSSGWLENPQRFALSNSLPLQADVFESEQCRPFFAGLLPEGHLRRLLTRQLQIDRDNDFVLLDELGGDCAGAVTLLEPGASPLPPGQPDIEWLDEAQLQVVLEELPHRPMLVGEAGMRLSLAGAQDKLPVVVEGDRIGLPRQGTPSTHILKPAIQGLADSVFNEAFCLTLAASLGLSVVPHRVLLVQGHAVLLVDRYDRRRSADGIWQRLHQEDFCQALGVAPESKYQSDGGPDLGQCFTLLRQVVRPSAPQVLRLVDAVIFNALIGNNDAHAKNFSLLRRQRGWELAPLYDLLSTAVYPRLTPNMAMKLGGKYRFAELQARHWERFAEASGLAPAPVRRRVCQMAQQLVVQAQAQAAISPFVGVALVSELVELIERRAAAALRLLD